MLLTCGVGEDSWESLGLQGDPTNPSIGNQSWIFIGRTDDEAEASIFWPPDAKNWLIWKDPDAGRLKARGEGDNRRWDGWVASPTQWTWVWVNSESWWWTGRPGMLQSMGSQRVVHNWTEKWLYYIMIWMSTRLLIYLCKIIMYSIWSFFFHSENLIVGNEPICNEILLMKSDWFKILEMTQCRTPALTSHPMHFSIQPHYIVFWRLYSMHIAGS